MTNKNHFRIFTLALLFLFLFNLQIQAQAERLRTPRQETLLNGLKMLVWEEPDADRVSVKLRIHSGSAFDPKHQEGTMALLSEILFPGQPSRDFFEEDLGGSLEIVNSYDYVQINVTAANDQILLLLQTLATAVANPTIDKDTTELVRAGMIARVWELEKDPAYLADQAIAERFYGDFPYGRPIFGSADSLNKIDFADLNFAKERLLTSDNATLTISGKVKSDLMYRAIRRYFGGWTKATEKTPSNFRLPDPVNEEDLLIQSPQASDVIEDRYAIEGVARNDDDFFSAKILEKILQVRFESESKQSGLKSSGVLLNSNFLRGDFVFSKNFDPLEIPVIEDVTLAVGGSAPEDVAKRRDHFLIEMLKQKITEQEFTTAKKAVLMEYQDSLSKNLAEVWLEKDTYRLASIPDQLKKLNQISLADVQKTVVRLQNSRVASISIVPA